MQPHFERFFAALDRRLRGDAALGLEILERLAFGQQIVSDRAHLDRLELLRIVQTFARFHHRLALGVDHRLAVGVELLLRHQVIPQAEEPRHFRRRAEIARVANPGEQEFVTILAGHIPQTRADLAERAGRFDIFQAALPLTTSAARGAAFSIALARK